MKFSKKHGLIWALIFAGACALYMGNNILRRPSLANQPLSVFLQRTQEQRIQHVVLQDQSLKVAETDGSVYAVQTPRYFNAIPLLEQNRIPFEYVSVESSISFLVLIQIFLPLILLIVTWFSFFRQVKSANGRTMGFGRSRAKMVDPDKNRMLFSDVAGVDEAKADLQEIVDFLKNPEKFQAIGGQIPKGVLLIGPPGTGKTLLAKAVAGEAGVPFFAISGSDFVEMFVGVGASRVRDLFAQAKQHAPCIVFIDEIDAVGRNRGSGMGGGHDEREQTLNQMLVEMDGFDVKEEVIVLAATNRIDVLDPALLRPGRFDRKVNVELPDLKGREAILNVHLKKVKVEPELSVRTIAKGTPGFSGADLANLVNEAALWAARHDKDIVEASDFEESRDKLIMGPERRSMAMTDHERRMTAYHEGGHAVVAFHSAHSDPIHKATIIPRGGALGMVVRLPELDRVSMSRARLHDDLAVALAGRVAEDLIFGHDFVTTGASSDFRMATDLARKMVKAWGMSDAVGLVAYSGGGQDGEFTWRDRSEAYAPETLELIDQEVKKLVEQAHRQARHILTTHRDHLELLAVTLLERETLSGHEIRHLLTNGCLPPQETSLDRLASSEDSGQDPEAQAQDSAMNDVLPVDTVHPQESVAPPSPPAP